MGEPVDPGLGAELASWADPLDMLTDAERDQLRRDLAAIAETRRRAYQAAANWWMS